MYKRRIFLSLSISATISQTIHWLFSIEYFAVVTRFPLITMAANPYSNLEEIHFKANKAKATIRVANVIFYTVVITVFIIGFWADPRNLNKIFYVWAFADTVLKLISGLLFIYSLLKF